MTKKYYRPDVNKISYESSNVRTCYVNSVVVYLAYASW